MEERLAQIFAEVCPDEVEKRAREHLALPLLQRVQREFGYIPREAIRPIARFARVPESQVYGVATFYAQFSLEPQGKYEISVCDGTACHVRRSVPVLQAIRSKLQLSPDQQTTGDLRFSLKTVSCLGACGLAPVVVINKKVYPQQTPESIARIIDEINRLEDAQS